MLIKKSHVPVREEKNGIKKIGAGLMTILDWGVVLLLVLGLLGMLFFCYFCILTVKVSRKLKYFRKRRTKNSKGQKGRNNKLVRLEGKYQKRRLWTVASLIGGLFFLASSLSVDHYRTINLGERDSRAIVEGYYLLREFASELDRSEKALGSQKKVESNLRYVLTSLCSFGVQNTSAAKRGTGQKKLNQYYGALEELGTNGITNYTKFYNNPKLITEYRQDIEKVRNYEKKVIEFYRINQVALKK